MTMINGMIFDFDRCCELIELIHCSHVLFCKFVLLYQCMRIVNRKSIVRLILLTQETLFTSCLSWKCVVNC